jgi:excisionase family DNA binding protein
MPRKSRPAPFLIHSKPPATVTIPDTSFGESLSQSIPSMIANRKGLMSAKQLAPLLGIGRPTLYQWAAQERIPSLTLNGQVRFDPKTIAAWLRARMSEKDRAA